MGKTCGWSWCGVEGISRGDIISFQRLLSIWALKCSTRKSPIAQCISHHPSYTVLCILFNFIPVKFLLLYGSLMLRFSYVSPVLSSALLTSLRPVLVSPGHTLLTALSFGLQEISVSLMSVLSPLFWVWLLEGCSMICSSAALGSCWITQTQIASAMGISISSWDKHGICIYSFTKSRDVLSKGMWSLGN